MSVIVSLVDNPCKPDSRVTRIAESLRDADNHVTVVCRQIPGLPPGEVVNGVGYLRVPMRGRLRAGPMKFRAYQSFVARTVMGIKPNFIHANDLVTLPAALRLGRATGAKVIYDVHDLYLHQPKRRSALSQWQAERIERHGIANVDAVITVSNGLADHLRDTYGISRPAVVMNAPDTSGSPASDVRTDIGLPDSFPLAVYTGGRQTNRRLHFTIRALEAMPDLHLVMVGPANPNDEMLRRYAYDIGADDRFHILSPVKHNEVARYISTANVGLITYHSDCLNHRLSMPTKLFEAVFAGLPVVVSNFSDLRSFVRKTLTGIDCDPRQPDDLASAIRHALERGRLEPGHLNQIAIHYGWPAQAKRLLTAYT